jgi:transposase
MSKTKIKRVLVCLFDITGIIHFEIVPGGTAVNPTFYVEVLKRRIDAVRHKRGELWRSLSLILHHDNASVHSALRVSQFLAGKGMSAMDYPPYCPDFWLFPKLKSMLKGKRIVGVENIKSFLGKNIDIHSCSVFQKLFKAMAETRDYFEIL